MKPLKKRSKSLAKYIPSTILSIGHYDINYSIELNDEEISKFKIKDLEKLQTYEDISFIIENKYLWSKIRIETENKTINLLLYLNKISIEANKSYIEYISYEAPIYCNESVKTMIKTVNDFNFFFINDCAINPKLKKSFNLKIKYRQKEAIIHFDKDEKNEKEEKNDLIKVVEENLNDIKNDNNENTKEAIGNINNEEVKNDNEGKENATNNEGNLEKEKNKENSGYLKNPKNIFNKIKFDCATYNYFFCSIEDTLEITPYEDFIEFIIYIKMNLRTNITIEYGDVTDFFNDKDSMNLLNKIFLLTDIFLFDEKDTINNFKKHYELLSKEEGKDKNKDIEIKSQKEGVDSRKFPESFEENNKSDSSSHQINKKKLEKKSKVINIINKEKNMTEKDLFDYFKRTIACNGTLSILNNKLAIFIDYYFSKVTFIEVPLYIKATTLTYEIKPYPKLSHSNVDIVELYKGKLRIYKSFFKSIFYAGVLNKIFIAKRKNIGLEVLYSAYLTGYEILKRMLNLLANEYKLPDNQKFYIVKIDNNEVNEYVQKEYYNNKENKFILDCTNPKKSKLKMYMPLFDNNLKDFYGHKLIRKELVNKGFINSEGFLNFDPVYMKNFWIYKNGGAQKSFHALSQKDILKKQVESNTKNMKNQVINNMQYIKIKLPSINSRIKK